jgi:hypothetical protein
MFRFLYSSFLHCICCCCRVYAHNKRRQTRTGKSFNQQEMGYVGTSSMDPNWPEAHLQSNEDELNDDEDNIDDQIDDIWSRMESRIPTLVVISIIVGYIYLGGIIFSMSQGWSMIISVYFCYITLATIGFGDYVCKRFE